MTTKEFGIWQSERSYRFKEEAIYNHAPENPGIYELVTFDDEQNPKVVYADWVKEKTIFARNISEVRHRARSFGS